MKKALQILVFAGPFLLLGCYTFKGPNNFYTNQSLLAANFTVPSPVAPSPTNSVEIALTAEYSHLAKFGLTAVGSATPQPSK